MSTPKPMPKTKLEKVEALIVALIKDAKKKVGKAGRIAVSDPDYAEAFGAHRGFLIAFYGAYDQSMLVTLPDGCVTTANDWFRSLRARGEC